MLTLLKHAYSTRLKSSKHAICQPKCRITAVVTLSTDINSKNEMMFHEMTWYLEIEKERSQG